MTTAYPLAWPAGWPRTKFRGSARFSKDGWQSSSYHPSGGYKVKRELTIADATTRVLNQLQKFGVESGEAIISTNLQLRLDGFPRSNQGEPSDPGVAVYWRARGAKTTKVMAVDRYDRVADNLAAIAATLDAMRAIERHGGAQILDRAFTGFTALPGQRTCWDILGLKQDQCTVDDVERAFRDLAKRHHPDLGGNADEFISIQRAREQAQEMLMS